MPSPAPIARGSLDDVVMGGASKSIIDPTTMLWSGTVTTANNGGLAAVGHHRVRRVVHARLGRAAAQAARVEAGAEGDDLAGASASAGTRRRRWRGLDGPMAAGRWAARSGS